MVRHDVKVEMIMELIHGGPGEFARLLLTIAPIEKLLLHLRKRSAVLGLKGPKGEPVLTLLMGENAKMSFVLNQEMIATLVMHLSSVATKN